MRTDACVHKHDDLVATQNNINNSAIINSGLNLAHVHIYNMQHTIICNTQCHDNIRHSRGSYQCDAIVVHLQYF